MIDYDELGKAVAKLSVSIQKVQRVTALMKLSKENNPYFPLVRVMCKLGLITNWSTL